MEIYPFYNDIFEDAGILKLKMNRTMAAEKSAFHHVIYLLVPWMKKIPSEWNRRSMAQRITGDLAETVDTIWNSLHGLIQKLDLLYQLRKAEPTITKYYLLRKAQ